MNRMLLSSSLLLAGLALSGCGSSSPLDEKVQAGDPQAYQSWQSQAADDLSAQQMALLQQAHQDIRLNLMESGSGDPDQGFCSAVDGKTVRQVIELGLHDRIQRLQGDLTKTQGMLKDNSSIRAVGDASQADVDNHIQEDQQRLQNDQTELKTAQDELSRIEGAK